jgi:hypothetical protein
MAIAFSSKKNSEQILIKLITKRINHTEFWFKLIQ